MVIQGWHDLMTDCTQRKTISVYIWQSIHTYIVIQGWHNLATDCARGKGASCGYGVCPSTYSTYESISSGCGMHLSIYSSILVVRLVAVEYVHPYMEVHPVAVEYIYPYMVIQG